ncbi:hypothetical protein K488DRAFT_17452, partial [Vararia minispora EC-137]
WKPLVDGLKCVVDAVDKIATAILRQKGLDEDVQRLMQCLEQTFTDLRTIEDLEVRCHDDQQASIMSRTLQQSYECGLFIQEYARDTSFWKRLVKNAITNERKTLSDRYISTLDDLKKAFISRTIVTTKVVVIQVADEVKGLSERFDAFGMYHTCYYASTMSLIILDARDLLREVPYAEGVWYDSNERPGCLQGTRARFLEAITKWANDPLSPSMLVLFGQAGMGKSTIAREIAQRFDAMTLGRNPRRSSRLEPYLLVTTLARNLASSHPSFRRSLVEVLRKLDPQVLHTRNCTTLFTHLLLNPLKNLHHLGPIVVVIDALDECGNELDCKALSSVLILAAVQLPSNFRFMVTARPETIFEEAFKEKPNISTLRMDDDRLADTSSDIQRYVRESLPPFVSPALGFSDAQCNQLAHAAGNLFQWAAVACVFITKPPHGLTSNDCFRQLLNNEHQNHVQKSLDELYDVVLHNIFPQFDNTLIAKRFRLVMGQLLASCEPLSRKAMAARIHAFELQEGSKDVVEESVDAILIHMGPLLGNVHVDNRPISLLHASFIDFLTQSKRSGIFTIDLHDVHRQLAHACLRLMHRDLVFNIAHLETSFKRNRDVLDLDTRVRHFISSHLLYACQYWDDHLENTHFDPELFSLVRKLLEDKFLSWLEVLSLTRKISLAIPAFASLKIW